MEFHPDYALRRVIGVLRITLKTRHFNVWPNTKSFSRADNGVWRARVPANEVKVKK